MEGTSCTVGSALRHTFRGPCGIGQGAPFLEEKTLRREKKKRGLMEMSLPQSVNDANKTSTVG